MTSTARTPSPRPRGFTLIELMVVILILGLLIGIVGPKVWHALKSGSIDSANFQMNSFGQAIELYYIENRTLPKTLDELTQPSRKTQEKYLDRVPEDPWKNAYQYRIINEGRKEYEISSAGEDKNWGTEDDLYFPERNTK